MQVIYKYTSLVRISDRSPSTNPIISKKKKKINLPIRDIILKVASDRKILLAAVTAAIIFTIFSRLGACTRAIVAARQIPCYLNIKRIP